MSSLTNLWLYAFTFLHFPLMHLEFTLVYRVRCGFNYAFFSDDYLVMPYHNGINLSLTILRLPLYYCVYVCMQAYIWGFFMLFH